MCSYGFPYGFPMIFLYFWLTLSNTLLMLTIRCRLHTYNSPQDPARDPRTTALHNTANEFVKVEQNKSIETKWEVGSMIWLKLALERTIQERKQHLALVIGNFENNWIRNSMTRSLAFRKWRSTPRTNTGSRDLPLSIPDHPSQTLRVYSICSETQMKRRTNEKLTMNRSTKRQIRLGDSRSGGSETSAR